MRFEELTDDQWRKLLVPSIPVPAHTGRPRADDGRSTINGILYVLLSGCRWMDMICLQSMAPSKQFGNDIRSGGVSKVYGKIL